MVSCSRAFRKPKNPEEERKLIENGTPKSTIPLKKYCLKTIFWNGRMVGKQNPLLELCVLSQLASLGCNAWTLL